MSAGRPEEYAEASTQNPQERPWSFKIPMGESQTINVPISFMGPMSVPMAVGAIVGDAINRGQDITDVLPTLAVSVGQFIGDQTMLKGISDFAFAFRQPQQYAERFVEGLATQTVPYGAAQRQVQQALGMAQRDPKGAIEAVLATSPLTAGTVPERQDRLGETVAPTQTGIAAYAGPVRFSVEDYNGVLAAFEDAGVGIPPPPKSVRTDAGTTVELDRDRQQQYQRIFGTELTRLYRDIRDPNPSQREKNARRALDQARETAKQETLVRMGGR